MRFDWWTLALQFVNVVVLIWILSRFLFRPVANIIAARQSTIEQSLADIAAKQAQVEAERATAERTRAGFEQERADLLAQAGVAAGREREAVLRAADTEARNRLGGADAMLSRLREESESRSVEQTIALASEIPAKLTGRLDSAAVRRAFADGLIERIEALPASRRALLASDPSLSIVTSSPLPPAELAALIERLSKTLGAAVHARAVPDPTLIGDR